METFSGLAFLHSGPGHLDYMGFPFCITARSSFFKEQDNFLEKKKLAKLGRGAAQHDMVTIFIRF
jgi:hypothetical protein